MQCRVLPRIEKWAHVKQVLFSHVLWAAGACTVLTSISGCLPKTPLSESIKGSAWKSSVADCVYTLMFVCLGVFHRGKLWLGFGCTSLLTWGFLQAQFVSSLCLLMGCTGRKLRRRKQSFSCLIYTEIEIVIFRRREKSLSWDWCFGFFLRVAGY